MVQGFLWELTGLNRRPSGGRLLKFFRGAFRSHTLVKTKTSYRLVPHRSVKPSPDKPFTQQTVIL